MAMWRCTQRAVHGGTDWTLGTGGARGRTRNMPYMSVTLDVSRLSGWLNADALCRASKEGHAGRGEVYGSGGAAGGGQLMRTQRAGEGSTADWGQGTGRSARRTCSPCP